MFQVVSTLESRLQIVQVLQHSSFDISYYTSFWCVVLVLVDYSKKFSIVLKTSFLAVLRVRLAVVVFAAGFAGFLVFVTLEALVALGFLVAVRLRVGLVANGSELSGSAPSITSMRPEVIL